MCAERIDYEVFGDGCFRSEPVNIIYDLIVGDTVYENRVAYNISDASEWVDNMDKVPGVKYRPKRYEPVRECVGAQ